MTSKASCNLRWSPGSIWLSRGRAPSAVLLVAALLGASCTARAAVTLLATEASSASWPSSEGLQLRLAPGAMLRFGEGQAAKSLSLVYGYDVYAFKDAYHHWEATYGEGPNGAYFGARYQNKNHVDQYEAGVVLGAPQLNFGVGLIFDSREKKVRSVTLRGTVPVLFLPVLLWKNLTS